MQFIRTIRMENILSYGVGMGEFALAPLNVLIGPNASGKSNLIEVLSLLQATPRDLRAPILTGGGVHEWLWKGTDQPSPALVEVTVENPSGPMPLRYRLSFTEVADRFTLHDERLENRDPQPSFAKPYFYYRYQEGDPVLNVKEEANSIRAERHLQRGNIRPDQSILSQRRDPDHYPELTFLSNRFERMRFSVIGEWTDGHLHVGRRE